MINYLKFKKENKGDNKNLNIELILSDLNNEKNLLVLRETF